ncbi:Vomeronasal Type-1 Receptor 4 [Manis pentadactyla]|nr:Vomeronasal Type-1 Receptor 4 [Manis pentadactyla]
MAVKNITALAVRKVEYTVRPVVLRYFKKSGVLDLGITLPSTRYLLCALHKGQQAVPLTPREGLMPHLWLSPEQPREQCGALNQVSPDEDIYIKPNSEDPKMLSLHPDPLGTAKESISRAMEMLLTYWRHDSEGLACSSSGVQAPSNSKSEGNL